MNSEISNNLVLLAEAMGKYSAYSYCVRQLACTEIADESITVSAAYEKLKAKIEARCHEAADDWQAIAASLDIIDINVDKRSN